MTHRRHSGESERTATPETIENLTLMNLHRCERAAACLALTLLTLCGDGVKDASAQKRAVSVSQTRATPRARQPPPLAEGDGRASSYLDEGQRHADAGDWAAALKAFKQVTAINPRHPEAHIYVGDAYMNLAKYEEAFAAYKEAIRIAPSNAEAYYSLGEAYNYLDTYSAAISPLVQATRLDPNYAEAHYGAGYAYLKQEDFKQALVYLRRAVRLRNNYPEAHLSLGLTYLGLGQIKTAEEQLKVLEGMDVALARELNKELRRVAAARPEADSRSSSVGTASEGLVVRPQPRKPETDVETSPPPTSRSPHAMTPKAESNPAMPPQTPSAQVQPAAASPSSGSTSQIAAEITFWDSIKNSDNPEEFDAYLSKYPSGEFVGLARIRLRTLESKRDGSGKPSDERKQEEEAAARTKTEVAKAAAAPVAEPASEPGAEARSTPTIEETLRLLKEGFSNNFTYTTTAPGEDANVVRVISEVVIEYEPLRFDNCRIEWRDRKDTISVAFSDLDPLGVKVEARSKPNTTFSIPIWTLTIETVGGAPAIQELKGDGSSVVNNYNSLDLQFGNKEKAEKLARLLQQAIKLCESVP